MALLRLHPTPTAHWQALIQDAQEKLSLSLDEELESYLIFLLIRFTTENNLPSHVAIEWLESFNHPESQQQENLRTIGDRCLIFSGLFPGVAEKRHVPIGYYVNIGRSAYYTLSGYKKSSLSSLFLHLHDNFVPLMDILHNTRFLTEETPCTLDLEQAQALWQETGSFYAKKCLDTLLNNPENR
jgi:hypothetical protein